jgi:hypothetical protein
MAEIKRSFAVAYHGGGRRYLTLRSACFAEARKAVREWCDKQGEDWRELDIDWYAPRVKRLAGMYKARFHRLTNGGDHG